MSKQINTVSDLPVGFTLESNSQDIEATLDYIGYEGDKDDYGCLFTLVGDGEVLEVYGCQSNIPYLHYSVDKLR